MLEVNVKVLETRQWIVEGFVFCSLRETHETALHLAPLLDELLPRTILSAAAGDKCTGSRFHEANEEATLKAR